MSIEQTYFDALKKITKFKTPEQLERSAEKQYGLSYLEALEMAYENMQDVARFATRGKRRPKSVSSGVSKQVAKEAAEDMARDMRGEIEG